MSLISSRELVIFALSDWICVSYLLAVLGFTMLDLLQLLLKIDWSDLTRDFGRDFLWELQTLTRDVCDVWGLGKFSFSTVFHLFNDLLEPCFAVFGFFIDVMGCLDVFEKPSTLSVFLWCGLSEVNGVVATVRIVSQAFIGIAFIWFLENFGLYSGYILIAGSDFKWLLADIGGLLYFLITFLNFIWALVSLSALIISNFCLIKSSAIWFIQQPYRLLLHTYLKLSVLILPMWLLSSARLS